MSTVILPRPNYDGAMSLEQALAARRTTRSFTAEPISLDQLAQLLWAAQGITGPDGRRNAPSAGAMFLLELCVLTRAGERLPAGAYRYLAATHSLERVSDRDPRAAVREAGIGEQPSLEQAAVVIIMAANAKEALDHFKDQQPLGERGFRYVNMEVGHAAQNIYLQATALSLGAVFVGGFDDESIARLQILSANHEPFGLMAIGHPDLVKKL
jgi:SagB-type dehydrogenase family enzyme